MATAWRKRIGQPERKALSAAVYRLNESCWRVGGGGEA